MKRKVFFIPLDEIVSHFKENSRQDVKIIAPDILTDHLFEMLKKKGKNIKKEKHLEGARWTHSKKSEANNICESSEFIDTCLPQYAQGPFAVSFANEHAEQEPHYHKQHWEIYFSEHSLGADYKLVEDSDYESIKLENGGVIIFGPGIIHMIYMSGITMIVETPSIAGDKETGD